MVVTRHCHYLRHYSARGRMIGESLIENYLECDHGQVYAPDCDMDILTEVLVVFLSPSKQMLKWYVKKATTASYTIQFIILHSLLTWAL